MADEPTTPQRGTPARPTRSGRTPRPAAKGGEALDRLGERAGRHSAVAALLAEHIGAETPRVAHPGGGPTQPGVAGARHAAQAAPGGPDSGPAVEDVALGVVSLVGEQLWRIGSRGVGVAAAAAAWGVGFVRAVSPRFATAEADALVASLADRGRRVRQERTAAMTSAVTGAITSAATSEAMREMTVAAIEEATDDVLAVVLPAMLEAVTELETQEKLDELMAGLLLRQLPAALEKTLPMVMLRTATKPAAGLVPFLGSVLPRE